MSTLDTSAAPYVVYQIDSESTDIVSISASTSTTASAASVAGSTR